MHLCGPLRADAEVRSVLSQRKAVPGFAPGLLDLQGLCLELLWPSSHLWTLHFWGALPNLQGFVLTIGVL